jgi:thiamine biosynthesis lipoprotein ApbE
LVGGIAGAIIGHEMSMYTHVHSLRTWRLTTFTAEHSDSDSERELQRELDEQQREIDEQQREIDEQREFDYGDDDY